MGSVFIDDDGKAKMRISESGEGDGLVFYDTDGLVKTRVKLDGGGGPADGSITTEKVADGAITDVKLANPKVNKSGDAMTGALDIIIGSDGHKMLLAKTQAQSGNNNAPTTIDLNSTYLIVGGTEYNTNSYRLIGFGYHRHGEKSHSPAVVGYQEINAGADDMGDVIMGTRNSTTDIAPTIHLRIKHDGQVELEQAGYVPIGDKAIPNKKYIDEFVASKLAAIDPIADPETATAEEVAIAFNTLLAVLK